MKLLASRLLLPLSMLFFHCNANEPVFKKTTIITYLGNGNVIVESIFKTVPNIPIRIMTDGIMAPNYMEVLKASINKESIDTSKFEFNYKKTEKGNFRYVSLKNAYYKNTSDSIYICYKTNILTPYQQSLIEGNYLFEIKMAESIPQAMPEVDVNSVLITKSQTELYIPRVLFFNNYKLLESDDKGNLKYSRNYLCTSFGELLFLLYPKIVFQLNNLRSIGQYDHWLDLRDLKLVEEGHRVNIKQIDSSKGLIFSLPFKEKIAHPDILLAFGDKNISPYPVDSIEFDSILHSVKISSNEAYYFVGPTLDLYSNKINYLLNIILSIPPNELGTLEIRYKYNSSNILKKLTYFQYEIHVEPQYLPTIKALDKLEISITDNFTFQKDESYKMYSYSLGEHSIIFNNVNRPEIFSNPLILPIVKDGLPFYKFIKIVNISIFIASILFLVIINYKIVNINLKKLPTILFQILLFIINLFLVGFSKEENIIELFIYVMGYLPMISVFIILLYIFNPYKKKSISIRVKNIKQD